MGTGEALRERVLHIVAERPGMTWQGLTRCVQASERADGASPSSSVSVAVALEDLRLTGRVTREGRVVREGDDAWFPVVLDWGVPPKAQTAEERAEYWGGGIPGAYAPNMDADWMGRWKAKLAGQKSGALRVEIRKTTCITRGSSVQVLIIVHEDGEVQMSMNGTAGFTEGGFAQMSRAVEEARTAMASWRAEHPLAASS